MNQFTHCQNDWCCIPLNPFQIRAQRTECGFCEMEKKKALQAQQIAQGLGEDDERKATA